MSFPTDDYTPHGYLEAPAHTRNLSPRGVLRSHGAGFRWHFPAYAGMYGGRRETYHAGFRVALDGALDLADLDRASSPYHSKNLFTFDLGRGAARAQATYHPVGEHALRATIAAHHASRVTIHVKYTRLLAANGEWGESGLVGRVEDGVLILQGFEDGDAFALWASRPPADLGITADAGEAAAWAASPAPGLPPEGFVTAIGDRGETVGLHAVLGFGLTTESTEDQDVRVDVSASVSPFSVASVADQIEVILARGKTADEARRRLDQARHDGRSELARRLAEDDAFWARAPRLAGDWPDHWRRGLVYDLETLRMMVRQPAGIYRHAWDAMQIQAPRVVLAETAIDALLLSYADARLAQDLLLGVFLDAPAPNVPCSREDGSYNMVAADGTVCGTAPAWGYPWLVVEWLAALRPDRAWLEQLYPRLAAYLDWWLAHRRDSEGWLVYVCSWESGQDDSPRFGTQPLGGGHPIRHVRPVDLHAAFAHACGVMARLAETLLLATERTERTESKNLSAVAGAHADTNIAAPLDSGSPAAAQPLDSASHAAVLAQEAQQWRALAEEFAGKTAQLWLAGQKLPDKETRRQGDEEMIAGRLSRPPGLPVSRSRSLDGARFADFDTRAGEFAAVDDLMLLAPLALGGALDAQVAALRPAIAAIDADALTWPMLAWTAAEAAAAAGLHDRAAELAAAVCERAYGFWDARVASAGRTLPGIACEYWPADGRCGGEGYGWGAFAAHLLLHTLVGLRPTANALVVRPNLPPSWRVAGRRYELELHWRDRTLAIELAPLVGERVVVEMNSKRAEIAWDEQLAYSWEDL